MKIVTEECFCDFCGNKCDDTTFVFPVVSSIGAKDKNGYTLKVFGKTIKAVQKNVCPECQEKIIHLLSLINGTTINKDGTLEISFK